MKVARLAQKKGGGGASYIYAPDISAFIFEKNREWILREPLAEVLGLPSPG
jgi:hypothetical protein